MILASGSWLLFHFTFRAFKVRPVGSTAAGDVFSGVLAVALAEKRPLPEALRFASAARAAVLRLRLSRLCVNVEPPRPAFARAA